MIPERKLKLLLDLMLTFSQNDRKFFGFCNICIVTVAFSFKAKRKRFSVVE